MFEVRYSLLEETWSLLSYAALVIRRSFFHQPHHAIEIRSFSRSADTIKWRRWKHRTGKRGTRQRGKPVLTTLTITVSHCLFILLAPPVWISSSEVHLLRLWIRVEKHNWYWRYLIYSLVLKVCRCFPFRCVVMYSCLVMVALWNRADHYIFILFLSSFFFFYFLA